MGEVSVSSGSTLTRSAEIILTVAIGVGGTNVLTHEPADIFPVKVEASSPGTLSGLFVAATDTTERQPEAIKAAFDSSRTSSRWHWYVSRRLRELEAGEYDFTDLQVPTSQVVQRARDVASSLFKPETPTPSVVPSGEGDVLYIWHKAGWDLEIDIGPEGTAVWARDRHAGRELYGSLEEQRAWVSGLLDFLAWH
jgi:hypothetical protein